MKAIERTEDVAARYDCGEQYPTVRASVREARRLAQEGYAYVVRLRYGVSTVRGPRVDYRENVLPMSGNHAVVRSVADAEALLGYDATKRARKSSAWRSRGVRDILREEQQSAEFAAQDAHLVREGYTLDEIDELDREGLLDDFGNVVE